MKMKFYLTNVLTFFEVVINGVNYEEQIDVLVHSERLLAQPFPTPPRSSPTITYQTPHGCGMVQESGGKVKYVIIEWQKRCESLSSLLLLFLMFFCMLWMSCRVKKVHYL